MIRYSNFLCALVKSACATRWLFLICKTNLISSLTTCKKFWDDWLNFMKYASAHKKTADKFPTFGFILFWFGLLLSFIFYIRRTYWNRKNFRLPVFNGFTHFEMFWLWFQNFYKNVCACLCVAQILWPR